MKRIGFILSAVLLVLSITSCRDGRIDRPIRDTITSVKKVGYFDKIVVNSPCDVVFTQGKTFSVKVIGDEDIVNSVSIEVKDEELNISGGHHFWFFDFFRGSGVTVYVTSPDILSVAMNGPGNFTVNGNIDSDTLNVSLHGSGDLRLGNVVCDKMTTSLKGVGDINIGHLECSTSSVDLAGTGNVSVNQRNVDNTDVSLRGTGDVNVNFDNCGSATCDLFGVGDITVSGSLEHFYETVRGTGDINSGGLSIRR